MVFLEALKCAQCGKQSDRARINRYSFGVSACKECAALICGNCTRKQLSCPRHPSCMIVYTYLSNICIFAIYAPEDELRLIDLQIAGNDHCAACNCKNSSLVRYGIQQVMCRKCPHLSYWWEASPTSLRERIFCKIISELNAHAMPKTRTQRNGVDGMLPVKIVVHCKACKRALDAYNAYNVILFDGEPHCFGCADEFPDFRHCKCLSLLIDLIQCIPENQLHLLTYSKWLKAVGCEQHRDILYKLNAVSADGTKTGKLRSFFKIEEIARTLNISETSSISNPTITVKTTDAANKIKPSTSTLSKLDASIPDKLEDIVSNPDISETSSIPKPTLTEETTAIAKDRKQNTSTLSKLDPSIPDKLLPDRITCSCGCEQEFSNMFDCLTCSTYGVCSLCLAKKHWGHEMKESKKTVAFCLINSQSEATRVKLIEMLGQAKDLNMEGEQSFEKLCEVLGIVFKDAMLSEDLLQIQSLLARANTSEIEKHFKNVMNCTRTLYKSMDSFCVDLLNAVEETENAKSTVKDAPRVGRK